MRLPNRRSTFRAALLEATKAHIILAQPIRPSKPLVMGGREVMGSDSFAVWFLFKGQNFDIARIYTRDGEWTGYYVDILETVEWEGADPTTLAPIVDLFLDLWITPAGRAHVLDEDELEEAERNGAIAGWDAAQARNELKELTQSIDAGRFPPQIVREFHPSPNEMVRMMDWWKT